MKIVSTVSLILALVNNVCLAQNKVQSYGKVDKADLELKECSFEKDANAMVLIDKGDIYFDSQFRLTADYFKRVKIFNEKAKNEANIRIEYISASNQEYITKIQAETINLNEDGKIEITKLDKKSIYHETVDKYRSAVVFTFPNVKNGSVIEFKYEWSTAAFWNFPDWYFQSHIPVRYSEVSTAVPEMLYYKPQIRTWQDFVKNTTTTSASSEGGGADAVVFNVEHNTRALANIPSLNDEPYMSSRTDNLECILYQLNAIKPMYGFSTTAADTWPKVGKHLADDEDFGKQFKRKLEGEDEIISKAMQFKTNDEKIAFIFNEVRNSMKWNGIDRWYTNEGTVRSWQKKTGNSTEINLIVYHLLKESGVEAFPMAVSTREHGKVYIAYPSLNNFNKTVTYVPVDSTKHYILDATDKYQSYNLIPASLLNSYGLLIDKENGRYDIVSINTNIPSRESVFLEAQIKPEGQITGYATLNKSDQYKFNVIKKYKTFGKKKYQESLRANIPGLKIDSFQMINTDIDSLPLSEKFRFNVMAAGADGNYIYFNPNIFSPLKSNPFLSEKRSTDIDFGYRSSYSIIGTYKLPEGYKVEAIPKSMTLVMPDRSISLTRIMGEQDGQILVRYNIDFKKTYFFKENYAAFREFYKKMFDMLNEQIVLKKS